MVEQSVGGAGDYHVHKMRRDALNPYFSQKAVMSFEALFRGKVQLLCDRFDESTLTGDPINLSDAYFALSNEYDLFLSELSAATTPTIDS